MIKNERGETFCRYGIKYNGEQEGWWAVAWYYVKEDPKYVGGHFMQFDKCPIEALKKLHMILSNDECEPVQPNQIKERPIEEAAK